MLRLLPIIALALLASGCADDNALDVTDAPPSEAGGVDDPAYTLRSVQMGDRACYLDLESASGEMDTRMADFDVCTRAEEGALVGRRVALQTERTDIMAMSCQGDPECADTEEVDLVVALTLAD